MSPHPPARRGFPLRKTLAILGILSAVASLPSAASPEGTSQAGVAIVRGIGPVEILTPCAGRAGCAPVYTVDAVRGWLTPFVGKRFHLGRITRRVKRHYDFLGYEASVEIDFKGGEIRARIEEAPAVVSEITLDVSRLAGVAAPELLEGMAPVAREHVPLRSLRTQAGDLVNRRRLARDEYDLALLGYDLVPVPPDPGDANQIYVLTRQPGIRRWREVRSAMEAEPPIDPLVKRSFSASGDYSRRDLFTARLYYQRSHLFSEFDSLEVSPYVSRQLAGAIVYQLPYILPAAITEWNVFAEARVYDEFTPDRLLDGVEADEERRGGRISLGVEPFRHLDGHSLKGWGYADRYHLSFGEFAIPVNGGQVSRSGQVPGAVLNDVTLFGATVEYAYHHLDRVPDFSWVFRPTAEFATKALGGDIAFRRVKGELEQHYAFSTGLELDARWKAGIVDRRVPVFEEFTLGGADSLRGFLRDDFLGRKFLAFQNDVWLPIPFRAFGKKSAFLGALERNLKTAITLDGGSVSFGDALNVRFARGVGVGLRYSAESSPTVVRADLAWGYWQGETRWYPYLSFTRKW